MGIENKNIVLKQQRKINGIVQFKTDLNVSYFFRMWGMLCRLFVRWQTVEQKSKSTQLVIKKITNQFFNPISNGQMDSIGGITRQKDLRNGKMCLEGV
jgi:hypothetical protein